MSVKPGKITRLNYLGQLSVDTSSYVITSIGAFHADKKDCQYLDTILEKIDNNIKEHGLAVEEIIADANYSSSSALESLISEGLLVISPIRVPINPNARALLMKKRTTVIYAPRVMF